MATVRTGAVAPETVAITVTPGRSGVDLSTVTSATMSVKRASGTIDTWTASISDQAADSLVVEHILRSGEVPRVETLKIVVFMRIPGGEVKSLPATLLVKDLYE